MFVLLIPLCTLGPAGGVEEIQREPLDDEESPGITRPSRSMLHRGAIGGIEWDWILPKKYDNIQ